MSGLRARPNNNLLRFNGTAHNNNHSEPVSSSSFKKPWSKSRLLSVLCIAWLIFTLCLAIMMVVSLVQPQWIGRNLSGAKASFGLYRTCSWTRTGDCEGSMLEFSDIPSTAWRAASMLVLLAVIACFVAVVLWAVFWLCLTERAHFGFRVCSILVFLAGIFFLLACFIYPGGFDASEIREICSDSADSYKFGNCKMMWVYWLAIICTIDSFILSCFAWLIVVKDDKILQPKRKPAALQNSTQCMELKAATLGRSSTSI